MTQVDELGWPGGHQVVTQWILQVHGGAERHDLWARLDDRLRLALAQGWVLGTQGRRDDDLAEDLAADDSDNALFDAMIHDLILHWRSVYQALRNGCGLWGQPILVGAGMELVVLTGPQHVGFVTAGTKVPGHCFITRLEADTWTIAALARRLPVPGWPPTEEVVPGLGIDG